LRAPEFFEHGTKSKIVGAKVVTPLGYAVGFVHGEQRDGHLPQSFEERSGPKPFRCYVHQLELTVPHATDALVLLGNRNRAVNQGGGETARNQSVYLILHERYQGRNNHGNPIKKDRWKLVTERFSATGWHDHKNVLPVQDRGDDLTLRLSELAETEISLKRLLGIHGLLLSA
jgi:hypothetical protein